MTRKPDNTSESRLDALRDEAARTGRVPGQGTAPAGGPIPAAGASSSYYGLPALKAPVWTWEIPLYFFIGGIAGASAAIAFAARLASATPALERAALWLALAAALICPVLLILDLGRPARFLHMLRVFKRQSPMSVGAWTLVLFTGAVIAAVVFNEALAAGSAFAGLAALRWVAEALAAASGLVLLSYTAVLLAVTAIPVWSENRNLLPTHFVASGIGSASALLELFGFLLPVTQLIGLAASAWEFAVGARIELRGRAVDEPLRSGRSGWTARAGAALAGPVALLLRIFRGDEAGGRELAAACFLLGALLIRYGWLWAGRASAADPRALFDLQRRP
jgi:formate-dependent nitrite reductase membrane component NrfD